MNKKFWLTYRKTVSVLGFLGIIFVFAINANAQTCAPAPVGLVSWHAGDGNALDSRGRSNGTLQNGATFGSGQVGQAFSFDGIDDLVDIPRNASVFALTRGTVEMWVKIPNLADNAVQLFSIADAGIAFPQSDQWTLGFRGGSDPSIQVSQVGGGTIFMSALTPGNSINDNNFHHIAVVADGVGDIQIYIDGVSQTLSGITTERFFGNAANADNMKIGGIERDNVSVGGSKTIDEVSIYNRALSAGEIQAIFNAGTAGKCKPTATVSPSGQVAWLAGDGNPNDISGNNNNGSLMSGAGFAVGRVGQGFSFDGVNDYVDVANTTSLDFGTGDFTIETWANFNSFAQDQSLFGKILGSFPNDQSYLLEFHAPNSLRFVVTDNASRNDLIIPTSLVTGTWYHIAAIRQGNTNLLYLNGSLVGQQTAGSNSNVGTGGTVYIGKLPVPATNLRNLSGKIDELSIYNRALPQGEITSIFNAGLAGKLKDNTTATGSNVAVNTKSDAMVTFPTVSAAGITQQIPLDLSTLPSLPLGSTTTGLTYDIATTATFTGSPQVCFNLPSIADSTIFNNLRILHLESNAWTNRTDLASINFATKTICTSGLTSLSPFAVVNGFGPSAANASISGRIVTENGGGIRNVIIQMTSGTGETKYAYSSSFGYYKFNDLPVGQTYVLTVLAKKYTFPNPTRLISLNEDLTDEDFVSEGK